MLCWHTLLRRCGRTNGQWLGLLNLGKGANLAGYKPAKPQTEAMLETRSAVDRNGSRCPPGRNLAGLDFRTTVVVDDFFQGFQIPFCAFIQRLF